MLVQSGRGRTVVHVVNQLDVGGTEKLLVEFARHADRASFDLHFVSLTQRGALAADIEAHGWPVTALQQPPGVRPALPFRLARLLRRLRADVVHTHNTKPLLYAAPAARMVGAKVVHTRHGQRFQAKARQTFLFRQASRLAHRFVCVSEDSARQSVAEGVAQAKLTTILNGIDVTRFTPAGPRAGGPVVMVGRLSPEKDAANLLRAVAHVVRVEPDFRLKIAGDGPCADDVRQLAADLGVAAQVEFLGTVRDVPGLLREASLFVLPSLTEGVSLTLLEAMAQALPVVATRVGGTPEVVADGETGLLVPAANPEALGEAILRLRRDPALGERMGRAGRLRVEARFDVSRAVAAYEALYVG